MNAELKIQAADGDRFSAYVATPASGRGPGLIVIQEIFGVNSIMRRIANTYAEMGYVAVVPDLFWRLQPGLELDDQNQVELEKAFELYQNFNEDRGVEDLIATLNAVKQLPSCTGKIGTVGYCLGGKLAYLMATRSSADCNVSYYGIGIENNLHEISNIQNPLLLHIAENDQFVPPEVQARIRMELSGHPLVDVYSYPQVSHAFARIGSPVYNAVMAELANSRTHPFLEQYLLS